MKNKNLNIRINEELLQKAKEKAKNETRPLSNYITYLIEDDLKKKEGKNMKQDILNELLELSGENLADLILDFEMNNQPMKLVYKGLSKDENDDIIIKVFDKNSECPFELKFNYATQKLDLN